MRTRVLVAMLMSVAVQAATVPKTFNQAGAGVTSDPADLTLWWKQFHDPELDSLMERAMKYNIDLRAAAARVAQARALERAQRSSLLPTLGLNSAFNRIRGGFS